MFGLKSEVVDQIIKVILKHNKIQRACIFGSRARTDYKRTSDIDIVIYGENISSTDLNLLRDDMYMLDIIYKMDIVYFNAISKEALKNNIEKEEIEIFNRSL